MAEKSGKRVVHTEQNVAGNYCYDIIEIDLKSPMDDGTTSFFKAEVYTTFTGQFGVGKDRTFTSRSRANHKRANELAEAALLSYETNPVANAVKEAVESNNLDAILGDN